MPLGDVAETFEVLGCKPSSVVQGRAHIYLSPKRPGSDMNLLRILLFEEVRVMTSGLDLMT